MFTLLFILGVLLFVGVFVSASFLHKKFMDIDV